MGASLTAVRITDDVYWVGAIDRDLRDFHGYATERGTTYNAYLVLADKVTLIDTVREPFFEEMLARIASVIDPARIDYIVSNHSELDHTGCLPQTIELVRPEKVFASSHGVKTLQAHFHRDLGVTAVEEGETVSLGNRTLTFIETRMLHWPDSMFCYMVEEELLFSQDGFGMHLASDERFADEIEPAILRSEAAKYYANILLPFSPMVKIGGKM
ncbi:MAG: FprA family A-type flavoprotein [Candidatus Hydrogenedentes bacterium]|nr:FprA family A-type flavoprotein [Candidatus Hydrogenedentota bacterium]